MDDISNLICAFQLLSVCEKICDNGDERQLQKDVVQYNCQQRQRLTANQQWHYDKIQQHLGSLLRCRQKSLDVPETVIGNFSAKNNKGLKLMVGMGYKEGEPLGKFKNGILEPLIVKPRPSRLGLGMSVVKKLSKGQRQRRNRAARKARMSTNLLLKENPKPEIKEEKIIPTEAKAEIKEEKIIPTFSSKEAKPAIKEEKIIPKFSLKKFNNAVHIPAISLHFRREVNLLQRHLITHFKNNTESSLLVLAKIVRTSNKTISSKTFQVVRDTIVGVIAEYQNEGKPTPIFHNVTNSGADIEIVCENAYAYECLQDSVIEMNQISGFHSISIYKTPNVTNLLECYGAIYKTITDAELFLSQIKLHVPALEAATKWVVVSHELFPNLCETHFILILDIQSALTIRYHFQNKLFICLHKVEFTKIGCVSATFVWNT